MSKASRSEIFLTPKFRLSFANGLWNPKPNQDGKLKWSVTMMVPKTSDISVFVNAAKVAASGKWPTNFENILKSCNCIKDGDTDKMLKGQHAGKLRCDVYPEVAGHYIIEAITYNDPFRNKAIVDQNVKPIMQESDLYSGCWCHAKVNAFTYDRDNSLGVSFGLSVLQKVAEGEHLGGGSLNAEDEFAPIPQEDSGPAAPQYADQAPAKATVSSVFG